MDELFDTLSEKNEFAKSNMLISAKYSSTLLDSKILALSLFELKHNADSLPEGETLSLVTSFSTKQLQKLVGRKGGSFYKQLNTTAQKMIGRSVGINDEENERFYYVNIIDDITYESGIFTIRYNKVIHNYLKMKKNFTMLDITIMMKFDSIYSFRLYELLKSKAVDENNIVLSSFKVYFNLAELKLSLGVINADLDKVKNILLASDENPDYEKAVALAPEKKFTSWSEFKRKVLDVAVKEINEKTDLLLIYTPISKGRGNKVYGIQFIVDQQPVVDKELPIFVPEDSEMLKKQEETFIAMAIQCVTEQIELDDLKLLAKEADYNPELFMKAYAASKRLPLEPFYLTDYLLETIREYKETTMTNIVDESTE